MPDGASFAECDQAMKELRGLLAESDFCLPFKARKALEKNLPIVDARIADLERQLRWDQGSA